jgi:hypothetical protein
MWERKKVQEVLFTQIERRSASQLRHQTAMAPKEPFESWPSSPASLFRALSIKLVLKKS